LPTIERLGGGVIDPNGKATVVNFWATYCVPCISEIPSFNAMNREFGSKGLLVAGVAMDEDTSIVAPFLKKHPMDYAIGIGTAAIAQQYEIPEALPVTLVYDKSGKLVKRFSGLLSESELKAAVEKALIPAS
jgi:thiol-disulfide isomerase/thioredoxin